MHCKFNHDDECQHCGFCQDDKPDVCDPMPVEPPKMHHGPWWDQTSTVVQGPSVQGQLNRLHAQMCSLANGMKDIKKHNYKMLKDIKHAAVSNGSYYSCKDVDVAHGVASTGGNYQVTRINRCDKAGNPIKVELHLAFSNAGNANIKEKAFNASEFEYADKMFAANTVKFTGGTGWNGPVVWKGAPLPYSEGVYGDGTSYVVGFTKCGDLRVYNQTVTHEDLRRDKIENAMGAVCQLVAGRTVIDRSWDLARLKGAPDALICIGQNYANKQTIFLSCGRYDEWGMGLQEAAEIMIQYGCDVAAVISEGESAAALDKGEMMFVPSTDDGNRPNETENYSYWYISRKCSYKDQWTFDWATLMQRYGQALWRSLMNEFAIDDLQDDMKSVMDDIADLQAQVATNTADIISLKSRVSALESTVGGFDARIRAIETAMTQLNNAFLQITQQFSNVLAQFEEIKTQFAALIVLVNSWNDRIVALEEEWAEYRDQLDEILATVSNKAPQTTFNKLNFAGMQGLPMRLVDAGNVEDEQFRFESQQEYFVWPRNVRDIIQGTRHAQYHFYIPLDKPITVAATAEDGLILRSRFLQTAQGKPNNICWINFRGIRQYDTTPWLRHQMHPDTAIGAPSTYILPNGAGYAGTYVGFEFYFQCDEWADRRVQFQLEVLSKLEVQPGGAVRPDAYYSAYSNYSANQSTKAFPNQYMRMARYSSGYMFTRLEHIGITPGRTNQSNFNVWNQYDTETFDNIMLMLMKFAPVSDYVVGKWRFEVDRNNANDYPFGLLNGWCTIEFIRGKGAGLNPDNSTSYDGDAVVYIEDLDHDSGYRWRRNIKCRAQSPMGPAGDANWVISKSVWYKFEGVES